MKNRINKLHPPTPFKGGIFNAKSLFEGSKVDVKISVCKYLTIILSLLSFTTFSQKLTVNQAIERAFVQNPSLKIISLEAESQRKLVPTARELPKANIELQVGRIQAYNAMDYTWGASQSFNHPKYYKTLANLLNKQVSVIEQNQNIRKNELAFQIKQIYTQIDNLRKAKTIINQQDSVYKIAKNIAVVKKETGETSKIDVIAAETEIDANSIRVQMIEQEEKQLVQRLKFLLNMPIGENLEPITETNLAIATPANQVSLIENNPLIQLQNQYKELVKSQLSHEQTKLLPEFKGGFFNQSMEKHYTPMILLGGVSIPLKTKPQKARLESLKINELIVQENQDYLRKDLEQQLQLQQINYDKFQLMDKYYREVALPKEEEMLDLTNKRYKNSEAIYYEYLQMIQRVFQTKAKYLQNLHDLKQTINEIEFLTGKS